MNIGRVVKKVISTIKNPAFSGRALLLVQPLNMALAPKGSEVLCIDFMGADIDEMVLILKEGSSVQQILDNKNAPADAAIVGIIDSIEFNSQNIFLKSTEIHSSK